MNNTLLPSRINLSLVPDPDPVVKKAPDPGSGSATLRGEMYDLHVTAGLWFVREADHGRTAWFAGDPDHGAYEFRIPQEVSAENQKEQPENSSSVLEALVYSGI